jgi:hypothetical protein
MTKPGYGANVYEDAAALDDAIATLDKVIAFDAKYVDGEIEKAYGMMKRRDELEAIRSQ